MRPVFEQKQYLRESRFVTARFYAADMAYNANERRIIRAVAAIDPLIRGLKVICRPV